MTTVLHKHSPAIAKQHLKNIVSSLEHRIEVARENHDSRLLELLLKEKAQLESFPGQWASVPRTLINTLGHLWHQIQQAIENADRLHVEKIVDEAGNVWWYAHDPHTGKALWAETQSEVVKWIEDNDLGR